jgi:hypothetical protein
MRFIMTADTSTSHRLSRVQLACCCLAASAFVLTAMLTASLAGRFAPLTADARADMVQMADDYVLMTALTRSNEESLFIIDNRQQKLMVYRTDASRQRMTPFIIEDIDAIFARRPVSR